MSNRFFLIRQNPLLNNVAIITDPHLLEIKQLTLRQNYLSISKNSSVIQVQSSKNNIYPDVLSEQLFLATSEIMSIIRTFDPEIMFSTFYLLDVQNQQMNSYDLPHIPVLKEGFTIAGDDIELASDFCCNHDIFKLEHRRNNYVVVSLLLAEAILRTDPKMISITHIDRRKT